MSRTVIYKAREENAQEACDVLRAYGFDAQVVDQSNPNLFHANRGAVWLRVSVPDDQVDQAREILDQWDNLENPNIERLTSGIFHELISSLIIMAAILTITFLIRGRWENWMATFAFLGWLLTFAIFSNIRHRKWVSGQ